MYQDEYNDPYYDDDDFDQFGNPNSGIVPQQKPNTPDGGLPAQSIAPPRSRDQWRNDWMGAGGGMKSWDDVNAWLGQHGGTVEDQRSGKIRTPHGELIDGVFDADNAGGQFRAGMWTATHDANAAKYGVVNSPNGGAATAATPLASSPSPEQPAQTAVQNGRRDQLFDMLMQRATQAKAVDRNDPTIRAEADAYSANEERAKRNYLGDIAEQSGPMANLRGEQRMASERVGQRTGAFEAQLMGRELQARRQEISEALLSMQGMLTADQQMALQRELATIDDATKRLGLDYQRDQFGRQLASNDRQFDANLGFQYENLDNAILRELLDKL
jgi:hypothetical protein